MLVTCFIVVLLFIALSGGCAYQPSVSKQQEQNCQLYTKKLALEQVETDGQVQISCSGKGCETVLLAHAIIPAGSFIVSGSVVLVGNALHWMEREGTCDDGFLKQQMNKFLGLFES